MASLSKWRGALRCGSVARARQRIAVANARQMSAFGEPSAHGKPAIPATITRKGNPVRDEVDLMIISVGGGFKFHVMKC